MGPKSKGKPASNKADWSFCSLSGLGFHSSDSAAHSSFLETSLNSPTTTATPGQTEAPPFPHIHNSVFRANVVVREESPTTSPQSFSRSQLFNSVFLPDFVAKACNIGFSSHVLVTSSSFTVVLRAYPHDKPETRPCCTPGSWLESLSADSQPVSVERFAGKVLLAPQVELTFQPGPSNPESAILESAKAFLGDKILYDSITVPFRYFGKNVKVSVRQVKSCDPDRLHEDSLCEELGSVSLSEHWTSTPQKTYATPKTKYFSITPTTNIARRTDVVRAPHLPCIGGLGPQLTLLTGTVNSIFSALSRKSVNGILLHGAPGVGKTLLAMHLQTQVRASFRFVAGPELYSKYYGETENKIRELMEEAERAAPTLLVLDELDTLAPRRDGEGGEQEKRVVATLQSCLDRLQLNQSRVAVIATTNRLESISPTLRRPGRLDLEVEVGVPGVEERSQILQVYLDQESHSLSRSDIETVAKETHGFVGADLSSLYGTALLAAQEMATPLGLQHFRSARSLVKPSAMREVQVEIPSVSWADIGGLDDLKLKLNQAVDWPIRHPEVFTRMGIKPPRGVLMYGPPGCSKTMIAKALANESGLNFLSIKGPELFSKWVGESEKAVRDLFKRARAVSPSIVFFDEIDALGASRGEGGSKVGERVLAQLLTEMDGVESLAGVTVLAATNRPDMMDRALLRPGRLDRVVYVPLPDLDTRRKVLSIHTAGMPVADTLDLDSVARRTDGYSGAELAAVCNEAALAALEEHSDASLVSEKHFESALATVKPRIQASLLRIYDEFREANTKS